MSKKKISPNQPSQDSRSRHTATPFFEKTGDVPDNNQTQTSDGNGGWQRYLKKHLWSVAVVAVLTLGALGATLKYLEEDAARQMRNSKSSDSEPQRESLLNSVNPFLTNSSAAMTSATPQLSKEYIYAGGKMLAVEDAGANAAPPADLAVWRPSNGTWYVLGGQGSQQTTMAWGQAGDRPAQGDFDGDGKTDFSVYRAASAQSNGHWYILHSSTSTFVDLDFGLGDDQLAQADYDGDGATDAAIYRPSNGTWVIRRSSDAVWVVQQWGVGQTAYKITPADFDGDGKADFAVWYDDPTNPSHIRQFTFKRSSDGQPQSIAFGQAGDLPVAGDYDGDGKADAAVWRPGSNQWLVWRSSDQTAKGYTFGVAGSDKAVQNDYDGDGLVDPAVWRESNGTWYILQSSKEGQSDYMRQTVWGQSGDIPVPAFYRR